MRKLYSIKIKNNLIKPNNQKSLKLKTKRTSIILLTNQLPSKVAILIVSWLILYHPLIPIPSQPSRSLMALTKWTLFICTTSQVVTSTCRPLHLKNLTWIIQYIHHNIQYKLSKRLWRHWQRLLISSSKLAWGLTILLPVSWTPQTNSLIARPQFVITTLLSSPSVKISSCVTPYQPSKSTRTSSRTITQEAPWTRMGSQALRKGINLGNPMLKEIHLKMLLVMITICELINFIIIILKVKNYT
jgi:hypothetical protein